MKLINDSLRTLERGFNVYGTPALAGTVVLSDGSIWPVVAIAAVLLVQAMTPALRQFLLAIADELGPAIGERLGAAVRRRRRRRARRRTRPVAVKSRDRGS
jgi:hypothetical protein